jgi:hypothetical protein
MQIASRLLLSAFKNPVQSGLVLGGSDILYSPGANSFRDLIAANDIVLSLAFENGHATIFLLSNALSIILSVEISNLVDE